MKVLIDSEKILELIFKRCQAFRLRLFSVIFDNIRMERTWIKESLFNIEKRV